MSGSRRGIWDGLRRRLGRAPAHPSPSGPHGDLGDLEQKYRSIFENAVEGIFQTSPSGRLIAANPALARICGYQTPEAFMAQLTDIEHQIYVQPGRRREFMGLMEEHDELRGFESEIYRKDGTVIWISENARAVHDGQGRLLYYAGTVQDVTERKRTEEERAQLLQEQLARARAEAALKALEEFLSVAAHELKTPVTSLRGFVQLLQRAVQKGHARLDSPQVRQALEVIDRQSAKLTHLMAQLLDLTRIQAGQLVLERRMADVTGLVRDAIEVAQARAEGHRFNLEAPAELDARVDPLRLEQVVTNLLDNAIKYSPEGGDIDVSLVPRQDGLLELAVRDHGLGIPAAARERIFERFYQAHAGDRSGMGLGLYVSARIAELHGGALRAEFPADGGSRFVLDLPVGLEAAGEEAPQAATGDGLARLEGTPQALADGPLRRTVGSAPESAGSAQSRHG